MTTELNLDSLNTQKLPFSRFLSPEANNLMTYENIARHITNVLDNTPDYRTRRRHNTSTKELNGLEAHDINKSLEKIGISLQKLIRHGEESLQLTHPSLVEHDSKDYYNEYFELEDDSLLEQLEQSVRDWLDAADMEAATMTHIHHHHHHHHFDYPHGKASYKSKCCLSILLWFVFIHL